MSLKGDTKKTEQTVLNTKKTEQTKFVLDNFWLEFLPSKLALQFKEGKARAVALPSCLNRHGKEGKAKVKGKVYALHKRQGQTKLVFF